MQSIGKLNDYLNRILGLSCKDRESVTSYIKSLPVYLRNSFLFYLLCVEDVDFLVFEPLKEMKGSALISSAKKLQEQTKLRTLILLPRIDTNLRRTLINGKVDFVVPDKQIYLPSMCIYLNERGLGIGAAGDKVIFSPAAQALLLYHLQVRPLEGLTLKEIASLLDYSAKTITLIAGELIKANICTLKSQVRCKLLTFIRSGKELWQIIEPMLESPIVQVYYINELPDNLEKIAKVSYDSALAHYSFLAEPKQRTVAIAKRNPIVRDLLVDKELHPTEGQIRVELWKYNPTLLSNISFVDRLSLVLCYKENEDERVNKEIGQLIDKMQW